MAKIGKDITGQRRYLKVKPEERLPDGRTKSELKNIYGFSNQGVNQLLKEASRYWNLNVFAVEIPERDVTFYIIADTKEEAFRKLPLKAQKLLYPKNIGKFKDLDHAEMLEIIKGHGIGRFE